MVDVLAIELLRLLLGRMGVEEIFESRMLTDLGRGSAGVLAEEGVGDETVASTVPRVAPCPLDALRPLVPSL